MVAGCLFCQIVDGAVPASVVWESASVLAFLDHRPLFPGHCLLIPRMHFETLADLPAEAVEPIFSQARLLARAMEEGLGADGSFLAINNKISQSVPHLHVHVVPRRRKDGLKGFFWPRGKYPDPAEMERVRSALEQTLRRLA
jgi:histidine triad (HIT) family protein